jgi:hypothetical protein
MFAKVRTFVGAIFPTPRRMTARYVLAPGLRPLLRAYPHHWLRLTRQHTGATWRILRQKQSRNAWTTGATERLALTQWLRADDTGRAPTLQ